MAENNLVNAESKPSIPYTLRLNETSYIQLKAMAGNAGKEFRFLYQVYDAAVIWASANRNQLPQFEKTRNGRSRTIYVTDSGSELQTMSTFLKCRESLALQFSITQYLRYKKQLTRLLHSV